MKNLKYSLFFLFLVSTFIACGSSSGGDGVNSKPISSDDNFTIDEDSTIEINLTASDSDGDELSFYLISQPANGTLSGTAPTFIYTPNPNYFGSDSFQFVADDGMAESNIATIRIAVNSMNDSPVGTDGTITVYYDSLPFVGVLQGSDVDGDNITFEIVDQPLFGDVEIINSQSGEYSYISDIPYGNDVFTFTISDGLTTSATINMQVVALAGSYFEAEENNSENTANDIYVSSVVRGNISTLTDEDWYSLDAVEGNYQIKMRVSGSSSYNNFLVELYDSTQTFLSRVEVDPESVALITEYLYFGVATADRYYIVIKQTGSTSTPPTEAYTFTVSETLADNASEIEPNQSYNLSTIVNLDEPMSGNISTLTDEDWYSLDAVEGNYQIKMRVSGSSSYNKFLVELYDSTQTFLSRVEVEPESIALITEYLYFGVATADRYYIVIKQTGSTSTPPTEAYTFTVSGT